MLETNITRPAAASIESQGSSFRVPHAQIIDPPQTTTRRKAARPESKEERGGSVPLSSVDEGGTHVRTGWGYEKQDPADSSERGLISLEKQGLVRDTLTTRTPDGDRD